MTARRRRAKPWAKRPRPGARELALQTIVAVESRSAFSDRLLETRLRDSGLSPEDSRLVTALVQGTLRHRATLDHHLKSFTRGGWEDLTPWIRGALRLAAFQILYLDRVPASAAVDESVELAKRYGHPGTAGLVNAVLRRLAGGDRAPMPDRDAHPIEHLSILHSHPTWIIERWVARYGREGAERLLEADNGEPPASLHPNALRASNEEVLARLRAEGFSPEPGPNGGPVLVIRGGFVASRSDAFREGLVSLQDEAESAVVSLLGARPTERALDLCAAPGGKTAQIAEAVGPGGMVVAMERHPSRARALRENVNRRLGIAHAHVLCADGARLPLRGTFDRVLVDAPCSGLGVLRRRADARWRKDPSTIAALAALQRPLVESAAGLVRPGGVLVYSVCSLEPEETVEIVEPFLRDHPAFTHEDADPHLPPGFRSGARNLTAWPPRHGTDGVFAARLRRR
ncbi:MAG: 16S rRNA (cytosine(967)-C(5))-methyltransferase RsmB [Candidatus Latescibacteria bacterium]|nr:16S rRNA (cytosine(967)-C(5))-methyltransferase RsmB [Candidatus Latescibacterota bacterium]